MEKVFQSVEDVITDEGFLAWYYRTDAAKAAAWEQWMKQHPSREQLVSEAVTCMRSITVTEQALPAGQAEAAHERLMQLLPQQAPLVKMPSRRRWMWTAAAAMVLIIAGSYFWTALNAQSSIETAYGQLSQRQLPDGSEVTLNANSSISYSEGWEKGKEREVWIRGEAFFHVKKTAAKSRFIVHTDQLDVVVTGTQFNVVSRGNTSSVMLTEGSVIIRTKDGRETRMVPGDFIEFSNSQLAKKPMEEEAVLAWKDKKIIFENTSLRDVVKKIKEHYGEDITIADEELAKKTITAIAPNDNLDVLLESLEATREFSVIRKDGRIIIANPQ
jgi:transmembrane sensor